VRRFGELEATIMDRLWARSEPATVREILDDLRKNRAIAYTTVMTVMDTLYRKRWLRRELDGRAYRYRPVASRESYTAQLMADALADSRDRPATFVAFVEQMSPRDAEALRAALRLVGRRQQRNDG
jgi:predicted transcriptional regulator